MIKLSTLFSSFLTFIFVTSSLYGQVPRKVVVEHFTNTKCSICASKNPGFYNNLSSQTDILHLAVHPSSPYSDCLLNNQNPTENDARTNYYGVYGSTPKFVIQGEVVPSSANLNNPSLFSPFQGQISPAEIRVTDEIFGTDSVGVQVVIKTISSHSLGALRVFVARAQDVLNYMAPNGEDKHYDVFVEALTAVTGDPVTLPATVGDSIVLNYSAKMFTPMQLSRLYSMVILQKESDKAVVQSEASSPGGGPTGIEAEKITGLKIYPNPSRGSVIVETGDIRQARIDVTDLNGRLIRTVRVSNGFETVSLSDLDAGIYIFRVSDEETSVVRRVILDPR